MKNKINLEVTTSQANFLLDALDVYLKQLRDNTDEHCQIKKQHWLVMV